MSHSAPTFSPAGTPLLDRTVGELVAERPGRSRIFQAFSIDFCCQGVRTLREACERKNIATATVVEQLEALGPKLGLNLARNALGEADGRDLACTGQYVFEKVVLETFLPIARRHGLPICISGGCALNVAVNQQLSELVELPIFVPPNPNDSGLAAGSAAAVM
jgi:predicted NodU family carbamoyl transferase